MPRKEIAVQQRAVQTKLFTSPHPTPPSWNQMTDTVKRRVVEALAQVLLGASGAEEKEDLDDCD